MPELHAHLEWEWESWSMEKGHTATEKCSFGVFFSIAVLVKLPNISTALLRHKDMTLLNPSTISHLLQFEVAYMKLVPCSYRVACVLKKQMSYLTMQFWNPLLEQLNEVCLVLTDGSFLCPPAHQCPPRQTNHCCLAKTKWPPSVRAQWHLHLLSDKPLKVQGKISALSVHIKSLISLHQRSLPVPHSRDRLNLKTDSHTEHFDFITTRHWIFIYFFFF